MSVRISVVTATGESGHVDVFRNDLVAEVKARLVKDSFPALGGQLFSLIYQGRELQDEEMLGAFNVKDLTKLRLILTISERQPYAPVNYEKVAQSLIQEGFKKPKSSTYFPSEWSGKWTKGDEYKKYPPVDVANPFSTIPPSSSREIVKGNSPPRGRTKSVDTLTCQVPERILKKRAERESNGVAAGQDLNEREELFRKARGGKGENNRSKSSSHGSDLDLERTFSNIYTCTVRGSKFSLIHCAEGTWQGMTTFSGEKFAANKAEPHVSSSKVVFNPQLSCWTERQLLTNPDGVSTRHELRYFPQADGLLHVRADQGFLRAAMIQLREVSARVLVLTATDEDGLPVLTEMITFADKNFSTRVRSGQRFSPDGELLASYLCHERKYVDEQSGAIETL